MIIEGNVFFDLCVFDDSMICNLHLLLVVGTNKKGITSRKF